MLRNARLGLGELCEEHGSWFLGSCAPEREGLPEGACCVLGARSGAAAFSCALRGRGVGWRSAGLSICPVQGRRSVSLSVCPMLPGAHPRYLAATHFPCLSAGATCPLSCDRSPAGHPCSFLGALFCAENLRLSSPFTLTDVALKVSWCGARRGDCPAVPALSSVPCQPFGHTLVAPAFPRRPFPWHRAATFSMASEISDLVSCCSRCCAPLLSALALLVLVPSPRWIIRLSEFTLGR